MAITVEPLTAFATSSSILKVRVSGSPSLPPAIFVSAVPSGAAVPFQTQALGSGVIEVCIKVPRAQKALKIAAANPLCGDVIGVPIF